MSISASDLVNKYVGQSEQMVKALFKVARDNAPCVIFVDEADSVLGARGKGGASDGATAGMERLLNQFLVEMQGVSNGDSNRRVVVIAGKNIQKRGQRSFFSKIRCVGRNESSVGPRRRRCASSSKGHLHLSSRI